MGKINRKLFTCFIAIAAIALAGCNTSQDETPEVTAENTEAATETEIEKETETETAEAVVDETEAYVPVFNQAETFFDYTVYLTDHAIYSHFDFGVGGMVPYYGTAADYALYVASPSMWEGTPVLVDGWDDVIEKCQPCMDEIMQELGMGNIISEGEAIPTILESEVVSVNGFETLKVNGVFSHAATEFSQRTETDYTAFYILANTENGQEAFFMFSTPIWDSGADPEPFMDEMVQHIERGNVK